MMMRLGMIKIKAIAGVANVFIGLLLPLSVAAQTVYPDHPVRLVVPFPPGGPTDIFARHVAAKLSDIHGQQFLVVNVPGAGGNVGTQTVVQSRPDGHTLLFASASIAISPSLYKSLPYDPVRDLEPISLVGIVPSILLTHAGGPASVKELIDTVKANPGKYAYASAGNGTTDHINGEIFRVRAGLDVTHVPYRGTAPAILDVIAGRNIFIFDFIGPTKSYITAGSLRVLAVATAKRSPLLPDVPTMTESGFPGFTTGTWNMILAAARTPRPILDLLSSSLNRVLQDRQIAERLTGLGIEPVANSTPDSARALLMEEIKRWKGLVELTGAKAD